MWSQTSNKAWHGHSRLCSELQRRKWITVSQGCPLDRRGSRVGRRVQGAVLERSHRLTCGARTAGLFFMSPPAHTAVFAFHGVSDSTLASSLPKWCKHKHIFETLVARPRCPSASSRLFKTLYSGRHFCNYRRTFFFSRQSVARPVVVSWRLVDGYRTFVLGRAACVLSDSLR